MRKLLIIILLLGSLPAFAQTIGPGWKPQNFKANNRDSAYYHKDVNFNSTVRVKENALRIGLVTVTANGTELNLLDGALVNTNELNNLVGVTGKTGTGNLVLNNSPTLLTPNLGTPSAVVLTNATGTASGLTAGSVSGFTPAGGSLTLSGADAITFTTTGVTSVTLPTSGTLATIQNINDSLDARIGDGVDIGDVAVLKTQLLSITSNLTAGAETNVTLTGVTTEPYSVQIFSSTGKDITHAVSDSVALNGGVYKLYVYSVDTLSGCKIKILY